MTITTDELHTEAAAASAGLRELADLIDRHPEFASAVEDETLRLYVPSWGPDPEARFADLVRKLGGHRAKGASEGYVAVTRQFGPLGVQVFINRAVVCERIVVGTETVEVPDPNAPKVTVEREVVEWKCGSVLLEGA